MPASKAPLLAALALFAGCSSLPLPDAERPPREAAFLQACRDATTDALALNLAAHPDDESARTLVYLRRKHGVRTVTVYSTCGEGGQNAIGREIGPALARLRTRETLAAAEHTGTEVHWLGFADFGYSKTAEETYRTWGKAAYTARLAAVIDQVRPDVMLTNHSPERGHGHHRASVTALREIAAQNAAKGWVVPVYQRAAADQADVKFDVNEVSYVTGLTYSRQAYKGWRQHRTQGIFGPFNWGRVRADSWELVHPADANGTDPIGTLGSLFDEPDFRAVAQELSVDAATLRDRFAEFGEHRPKAEHLQRARELLPVMRRFAPRLTSGPAKLRLDRRIDALERVILEGSGVTIRSGLAQERLAEGSSGTIDVRVETADNATRIGGLAAALAGVSVESGADGSVRIPFGPLRDVDHGNVAPSFFRPVVALEVDGIDIRRVVPVRYTAVPRVALHLERPVRLVPATAKGAKVDAAVEIAWNGAEPLQTALRVESANGFAVQVDEASIRLPAGGDATRRNLRVQLPDHALSGDEAIQLSLDTGTVELRLRPVDVHAPADLRVGLIRGPDDTLRLALEDLKIGFEELDAAALPGADLTRFTTLVIDIRAYRTRTDLVGQRDRILDWCKAGGRVLCFYHKPNEWNATAKRPLLAPYTLEVGRLRVCEEDAAVEILDPQHRLWNHPNKIVQSDFDGWVQERGLNFPQKWDKRWQPMIEMADTGEKPLRGAMLYTTHGRGDYIYCSLALYRQLRQGHPGAARLLVNLLSR